MLKCWFFQAFFEVMMYVVSDFLDGLLFVNCGMRMRREELCCWRSCFLDVVVVHCVLSSYCYRVGSICRLS